MAEEHMIDISASFRRKLNILLEDIRDVRDQGKKVSSDPGQMFLFRGMFTTVDSLYERYSEVYNDLCDLTGEDGSPVVVANDHLARNNAKRYMHEAHAIMLAAQERAGPSTSGVVNTNTTCSGSRARAKLPTISLPTFSGTRTEWPRFRDLFESLVIGDDELQNIDRYHYLVASLRDPAGAIIANFPINEDNFTVAWQTLKDHYDNKRLLACTYLDEMLDVKVLERKPPCSILSERIALLSKSVAAFKSLRIPNDIDFMFFHVASKGLDADTRTAFENANSAQFPTFDELISFLRKRCATSELINSLTSNTHASKPLSIPKNPSKQPGVGKSVLLTHNNPSPIKHKTSVRASSGSYSSSRKARELNNTCVACGDKHFLLNCSKFTRAALGERHLLLKGWNGCRNCLQPSHVTNTCPSKYRCRLCKGKHHSLLCNVSVNTSNCTTPSVTSTCNPHQVEPTPSPQARPATSLNSTMLYQMDILLGTAICLIGTSTPTHPIRLVIDSGSHSSFITRDCANRVGLQIEPLHTDIWGIGETPLKGFKGQAKCTLSPQRSRYPTLSASVIVVDKITTPLPGFTTSSDIWQQYLDYDLADPDFWVSKPIDMLLGCDLFGEILTGQTITIKPEMPKLLGTVFGFAALGRLKDLTEAAHICSLHAFAPHEHSNIDIDLQRFWELEEPPPTDKLSPEEERCETLFRDTHYRLPSGRYGVRLPFKESRPRFGGSRAMAMRRLTHLESKLARNPNLKEKYHAFMREYLDLGHMSLVTQPGEYYIPHHCVIKGDGPNLKIRVVFDAASRAGSGSLNDALLVGPKLQSNLSIILLGFRLHQFVFTADAIKMYRQIDVHPEDRSYQHIVWRFDPSKPVEEYQLNTLAYGTTCAPYEALRVIQQLVIDEGDSFPLAARVLQEDIYVDDIATGSSSLQESLNILQQVVALLKKGCFSLSKWAANHPDLLAAGHANSPNDATDSQQPVTFESSDDDMSVKILGLQWDPRTDEFSYRINPPPTVCTKRGVLSAVAKIYDPLGYLGPAVVLAKQAVQRAWKIQLGWDEKFPEDLEADWRILIDQLSTLTHIRIPRWILPVDTLEINILIFADASERAYCASAFLRTTHPSGVSSHLLMARTKLAPVKPVTIPRLELCASLLATRLWQSLQPFCQRLPIRPSVYFFTDSTVVLAWIQTPAFRLKTFVGNRVAKIRELTGDGSWHHVSSKDNPSDLGSRGVLPEQLINSDLWFKGPSWITMPTKDWPLKVCVSPKELPELKPTNTRTLVTNTPTSNIVNWFARFSSFSKLIRSLAYVLRFTSLLKRDKVRRIGLITVQEMRNATRVAVRLVQAHSFFNSSKFVSTDTPIPKNLSNLNPFFDKGGVLLVGGRLRHSDISWSQKHPILLPAKSHLGSLIMEHYHRILLHPGPTILLASLRTRYWIINARGTARHLTRSCVTCRKLAAPPVQPLMGDLPQCRFKEGRAFLHVGTDFAGPFTIRESLRRKAPQLKAYLCLFVCLSTKALHLELVSDLSTAAFRAALNRFIGRRGLPEKILSDNGTNFVGASNELKAVYSWLKEQGTQDFISNFSTQKEITWEFNPAHAPSFGGVWEAGVKSVKRLLRSVYNSHLMTFEEMSTLLVEIEAILNSRPLCPMSSNPDDLTYLSPGHFLIGSPLLVIPEPSLVELPENRLSRWEVICQKAQHFWKRWRTEYISSLQERVKWKHPSYNLRVGDLVLVKNEQLPRCQWPLARVTKVHPGEDNIVRVATVKTSYSSTLNRPTNKLIPLFLPTPSLPSDPIPSESTKEEEN